jgi:hypothetical protein
MFKISNPIARGLALGTSGHTLGVAIGFEILNIFTIFPPNAEITTALRITANDVNSFTPPIPSDTGKIQLHVV